MYTCILHVIILASSNCCKRFSLKLSLFNSLSICYDSSIYYPMHLCTYFYNNERHWTPDCSVFWFRERNRNHSSLLSSIPISTVMTYFDLSRLSIHCYHIIIFFDTDLSFIDKANKSIGLFFYCPISAWIGMTMETGWSTLPIGSTLNFKI